MCCWFPLFLLVSLTCCPALCSVLLQGTRKPAQAAYERILAHAACDPKNLLFVDDRPVNIQGAQAAGIPSILFKGAQHLEEQLRTQGLEF